MKVMSICRGVLESIRRSCSSVSSILGMRFRMQSSRGRMS